MEIKIGGRVYPQFRKDLDRRRRMGEVDTASFTIDTAGLPVPVAAEPVVLTSSTGVYFLGNVRAVAPVAGSETAYTIDCLGSPAETPPPVE
jgi:hypothetical protein